jgi:hypothetical protein
LGLLRIENKEDFEENAHDPTSGLFRLRRHGFDRDAGFPFGLVREGAEDR